MALFGKKKSLVGLDIGSSSIKAVEVKPAKGESWELANVGIEYLLPRPLWMAKLWTRRP